MTRIIRSKSKISRRLNVNLWDRENDAFLVRNYGPGQHGREGMNKPGTDYKKQLRAKQILRMYYYINERQFRRTYELAEKKRGDTIANLIGLLESRLDASVYRMNLAPTIFMARQLVSHNHVRVNGQKVNIGSYKLRAGDIVSLTEKAKQIPGVMESVSKMTRSIPDYIDFDAKAFEGKLTRIPDALADVPYPMEMDINLIIGYYSR